MKLRKYVRKLISILMIHLISTRIKILQIDDCKDTLIFSNALNTSQNPEKPVIVMGTDSYLLAILIAWEIIGLFLIFFNKPKEEHILNSTKIQVAMKEPFLFFTKLWYNIICIQEGEKDKFKSTEKKYVVLWIPIKKW